MIQYLLEHLFDYLFQHLVNSLAANNEAQRLTVPQETTASSSHSNDPPSTSSMAVEPSSAMPPPGTELSPKDDKSTSIQVCFMDPVKKRMVNYDMSVQRSMKVEDVKRQLHGQISDNVEHWSNLAILFMGKELPNQLEIDGCDLGENSMLHALDSVKVKGRAMVAYPQEEASKSVAPLAKLPSKLTTIEEPPQLVTHEAIRSADTQATKLYFFVYCLACDGLRNGKLRVACAACDHGSILFMNEPQDWSDVLLPDRIESKCYAPGCTGNRARFYFKCIDQSQHNTENSPTVPTTSGLVYPLNRLRRNNIHISCLACMDTQVDVVLVFPCDHAICLECFRDYCKTALSERNLSWVESLGYTVNCPIDCADSWLETPHLNLLDGHYYSLYTRFSAEELVLKNGGILCPYTDCDQPHYPPVMPPPACEVTECAKCRLVYCVLCTHEGQYAPVSCPFESLIEQTNATIRENSSRQRTKLSTTTQQNSTYLSSLIAKFSSLRALARNVTGLGVPDSTVEEPPRWQDTMSRLKIREITKPCPKCRTPTERNGGCMHMVCTRRKCNHNWCWICLTEWSSDCMATHWFG